MNRPQAQPEKPAYSVPTMAEIAEIPWNGFRVCSTFAGAGGSSLGYRMAGFRVLWANEFVESARDTYQANQAPHTIVDGRDIRQVESRSLLDAVGLKAGELDVLDGSPPCASFSLAGRRQQHWGSVKKYSDTEQRVDDLFAEFVRLVDGVRPKVFVAENVSGLVKGVAKGQFLRVLAAFKACGYQVEARLLDAQWLGVPQRRERIIFIGVRNDLGRVPAFPDPLPYWYSVREAIPWIERVEHPNGFTGHEMQSAGGVMATVQASRPVRVETKQGARSVDEPAPTVQTHGRRGTQSELTIAAAGDVGPSIEGYEIANEWDKILPGQASSRYFSLRKPDPDEPSPTITSPPQGDFSPSANLSSASIVHPFEKRKFAIAELKRICAFPDDFVLLGTYAQQWERLGRAVPPVMMRAIAGVIRDRILRE